MYDLTKKDIQDRLINIDGTIQKLGAMLKDGSMSAEAYAEVVPLIARCTEYQKAHLDILRNAEAWDFRKLNEIKDKSRIGAASAYITAMSYLNRVLNV